MSYAPPPFDKGPVDQRQRFLKWLFALAILASLAAMISVTLQSRSTAPRFGARLAFPQLDRHLAELNSLKVVSASETLTLDLLVPDQWVIRERNNYPAKIEAVRRLALGLTDLELVEPKTARKDWHSHLGLGDPADGGDGTRFQALTSEGTVLADLVAGAEQGLPDLNGDTFRYVRLGGDSQTYLARGQLDLGSDFEVWADLEVLSFERERVMSVTSGIGDGADTGQGFTAHRPSPDTYNFELAAIPAGFEPNSPGIANGVGSSLSAMTFLDVRPASAISFRGARHLRFETFDALYIDVDIVLLDEGYWLKFAISDASTAAGTDAARATLVRDLNQPGVEWAFKVPNWKGDQMTMALGDMIKISGETNE